MTNAQDLITKLKIKGPHKTEKTPRRVRGLFNGKFVFDTTEAVYVWEHPYCINLPTRVTSKQADISFDPYYYIPKQAFADGVLENPVEGDKFAQTAKLTMGKKSTENVIVFSSSSAGSLAGLVRVDFNSIDIWFVEEEQIYQHPKDSYRRVECVQSNRPVTIKIKGQIIAQSSSNIFLYETGLPPRYYLSPTSVNWELLSPSETTSVCPYKGVASYYDVTLKDGTEIRDAIWWYKYPTTESAAIAGRLCFYPEIADIYIDGQKV